ncbi:hypothetical protein Vafri_15714 [Volvox africanus]|nr:hypothetical protein Vafri_15714 [Volvox africanus]
MHSKLKLNVIDTSQSSNLPRYYQGQKRSRTTQCRSFLGDVIKIFGRKFDEGTRSQQRSTVDVSLIGSENGRPFFPPYNVVSKNSEYSLRLYNVFPVVEMDYQRREEGYAILGSYIDGRNSENICYAYTQPVVMCYYPDGRKVMQMFICPQQTVASKRELQQGASAAPAPTLLPGPLDPAVRVNVSGGELVAILQFEGYITPANAEAARQRLLTYLQRDGIRLSEADTAGRFRCAQYGAVYQLGGRLNEIMLQVDV